jgi:HEAT repeat protein
MPASDNKTVTLDQVIAALVQSTNGAADDALLEALKVGTPPEVARALDGLFQRRTTAALNGVVERYADLPAELRPGVLEHLDLLMTAVREVGRDGVSDARLSAIRLVVDARAGQLSHVLSDNLRHADLTVATAAANALVSMAEWVATGVRQLQRSDSADGTEVAAGAGATYEQIVRDRVDIEQAVCRALEVGRDRPGTERLMNEVVRAAVLLMDSTASKVMTLLRGPRHSGQAALAKRTSQTPSADGVDAFLLGAAHGGQRTTFANGIARVADAPALDALLRRTHWLKDGALLACMAGVSRGAWWSDAELSRDVSARHGDDAAKVGRWIAASGSADAVQDERLISVRRQLLQAEPNNVAARAELFRVAAGRPNGASTMLITAFLDDPDERLSRLAAREITRRRPADYRSLLMARMGQAAPSVRRVIGRAVGQAGFDQFWANFDNMDATQRRTAGRVLLKMMPDLPGRLNRRLAAGGGPGAGSVNDRLKALRMAAELGVARQVAPALIRLCGDPSPRVRSKAVALLGDVPTVSLDALVERLLNDPDARVRANAVEVLEGRQGPGKVGTPGFVPTLVSRARSGSNRERANAIRALHRLRMDDVADALTTMLSDPRAEHRVSALWAVKETGLWNLVGRVGQMAKADPNGGVRQYAVGVLRTVSELIRTQQASQLRQAG